MLDFFGILNEFDHSRVGVRLVQSKENFIILVFKIILKRERIIVVFHMMVSRQVDTAKSDSLPTFKPAPILIPGLINRKDRHKHPLIEKRCLFDHVSNSKPPDTLLLIFNPEEEPVIIAISVKIILNKHIILHRFFRINISST